MCEIRSWKINDASDLAFALNNKKILDNLRDGLPFPYTVADATEFINAKLGADSNKTYAFAIVFENKVVGSIGAFRQENVHSRTAEIGYYISEACWGKGIGTSAVKQVCEFVFSNTDILRIFAEPFAHNIASCRILEKAGFSLEGTLRKNAIKNNTIIDMKMYSFNKRVIIICHSTYPTNSNLLDG